MDSNTHSTVPPGPPELPVPSALPAPPYPQELPALEEELELPTAPQSAAALGLLPAAVRELADEDLNQLTDTALGDEIDALRHWMDCLEGQWLRRIATADARGTAAADQRHPTPSTANWLCRRLRVGAGTAHQAVQTARALFRGPLPATAEALLGGVISPAHARVLAQGTRQVPDQVATAAEPVLLEAARHLDPPLLRKAVGHLLEVADPSVADEALERRHARRGLWLSPTIDGMVAVDGLLEAEAGQTVLDALEPLARPSDADDTRLGGQRTADALAELARRALEGGRLPKVGGVRPQLLVTVDLDCLLGLPGAVGGDLGWAGPLDPQACRRLACDGAVTRVAVSRQSTSHQPADGEQPHPGHRAHADLGNPSDQGACRDQSTEDPSSTMEGLSGWLRRAMVLLPPTLGGAPSQPLDVGQSTRVIQPAQRAALAVRDRGCVFPGCDRPLAWCEAHHLWHWIDGGPTDLANLAMVCRAHHRTVHEGGWHLIRGPDGRFVAAPGRRGHHPAA